MKAPVIFRKFKIGEDFDKEEIIAVFPEEDYFHYPSSTKMSYMHVGQHSACELSHIKDVTVPATKSEYQDLKEELESIGYKLEVTVMHLICC